MYTLDLEMYKAAGCNLTSLTLVDMQSESVGQLIVDLRTNIGAHVDPPFVLPTVGIPVCHHHCMSIVLIDVDCCDARLVAFTRRRVDTHRLDCIRKDKLSRS